MTQPMQISISHETCGKVIQSSSLFVQVVQFSELSSIILMPTCSLYIERTCLRIKSTQKKLKPRDGEEGMEDKETQKSRGKGKKREREKHIINLLKPSVP